MRACVLILFAFSTLAGCELAPDPSLACEPNPCGPGTCTGLENPPFRDAPAAQRVRLTYTCDCPDGFVYRDKTCVQDWACQGHLACRDYSFERCPALCEPVEGYCDSPYDGLTCRGRRSEGSCTPYGCDWYPSACQPSSTCPDVTDKAACPEDRCEIRPAFID